MGAGIDSAMIRARAIGNGAAKDIPDPPKTEMVTGNPAMAFWTTLCILAPEPVWTLDFISPHCPLLSAIASPGPKTGQKSKGAGSEAEAFR
jgi:hypothetical protein